MSDTNLATIQEIISVSPIEGADRIEEIVVEGWHTVAKKGEFQVGSTCILFIVDAIVPDTPAFSFLKGDRRIRTRKFRKCPAQGLALPLTEFAEELASKGIRDLEVGMDLTEALGVIKYTKELPANLRGKRAGNFPGYVHKTDEENIQRCKRVLEELKGIPLYITAKIDGSSATYIAKDGEFHVCSRNLELKRPEGDEKNVFWDMAYKYCLEDKMLKKWHDRLANSLEADFAIQGEIDGPGINGNSRGLAEHEFSVFNVYFIKEGTYADFPLTYFYASEVGAQMVPVIEKDYILPEDTTVESLLVMAEGTYPGTDKMREGLVFRPMKPMYSPTLRGRLSFKAVSRRYLLEKEK